MGVEIGPIILGISLMVALLTYVVATRRESDIDLAIRKIKKFDERLEKELGAKGDGFEKKINSVKHRLPPKTIEQLHKIRIERNDLAHTNKLDTLNDRRKFIRSCNDIEKELDRRKASGDRSGCLLAFLFAIALTYLIFQNPL